MEEDQSLSQCLTLGAEGETRQSLPRPRHTGFKAVSTGRQGGTGEQVQTNRIPSPLMGEESKVRVNKTKTPPLPQSTALMQQNNPYKHNNPKNNCHNTLDNTKHHVQLKVCLAEEKRTTPKPSPRKAGRG